MSAGEMKRVVFVHDSCDSKRVIRLAGEGAEVHVDEIFLKGNIKSSLKIIHDARNTKSRIHSRGVVDRNQRAVAHAVVVIPKHAQLTDSFVSQDFLMLDSSASVDALPSLEIEADDVKAAHAATISCLDEEKLFYMTSRGMSKMQARDLIVEGFLRLPEGYSWKK